jgi:hypothetical protein
MGGEMNRRIFLKNIISLPFLLPFGFSLPTKIEDEPLIIGVDRAEPGNDQTIITKYSLDDYARAAGITFWHGPINREWRKK